MAIRSCTQAPGHMLDDGAHLRAARGTRRTQDRRHRRAARHVIDMHGRKATLVVMRVPERKLLTAMRRAERVVDVENRLFARPHRRAGLVDQRGGEPCCLRLARRILKTADRRLRRQRRPGCRTAADRNLHQRIMPQPIEVDGILVAAGNRRDPRHHHFEHLVLDPARVAAIRHRSRKPRAYTKSALRLSQQQQTTIRRLIAAVKINCEFLALHRWKVKRKQRIVAHGGCGGGLMHFAIRANTDLLRESRASCHSRLPIPRRHA